MSERVERTITKVLLVPLSTGKRLKYLEEMIENQFAADQIAIEIEPKKADMKTFQKISDDARHKLTVGEKQQVKCLEIIDFDKRLAYTTRLDTNEELPDREITEKDEQMTTGDEIQEEIEGV